MSEITHGELNALVNRFIEVCHPGPGERPKAVNEILDLADCADLGELQAFEYLWPDLAEKLNARIKAALPIPRKAMRFRPGAALAIEQKARAAIREHGVRAGLLVYAQQFVKPVHDGETLRLIPYSAASFASKLNELIAFIPPDAKKRKKKKDATEQAPDEPAAAPLPLDCPPDLRNALMSATGLSELPELTINAVVATPVLKDGELHAAEGFDASLNVYFNAPTVDVTSDCDREHALAALSRLVDWLNEFAFASDVDRSVALAGILTAALRGSMAHAPGFLITKPEFGAGASTLCEFFYAILSGRQMPVVAAAIDREELRKQVDSAGMSADPAIVFDNLRDGFELTSPELAQVLSQTRRSVRRLGVSEMVEVTCSQLVLANGCNVRVGQDLVRRFVLCELDPQMENPEDRTFKRADLIADALRDRVQILADCYTVVLAYLESDEKVAALPLAGFAQWRHLVQEPLVWLGLADPLLSRAKIQSEDSGKANFASLLAAWRTLHGSSPATAATIVEDAESHPAEDLDQPDTSERAEARREIKRVLDEIAMEPNGKRPSARRFGYYLRSKRNRIANGLRLETHGTVHAKTAAWRVTVQPAKEIAKNDTTEATDTTWLDL